MNKKIALTDLSIVIPFYNENKRINKSIKILKKFIQDNNYKIEIVFVNDGSTDKSEKIIKQKFKKFLSKNLNLVFINYKKNIGKGFAIKKGILKSSSKWILTCDFDMSVNPSLINKWFNKNYVNNYNKAYFGSRNLVKSKVDTIFYRKLYGSLFKFIIMILFKIRLNDTQCGFKLYNCSYIKKIIKKITSYGFVHDVEIINELKKKNIGLVELPVVWKHEGNSKLNLLYDPLKMIFDLIKIKMK
tara:strand:- start:4380 stop:5111 length:732 start_codon:yes stop_codon:yes gene_type:complete